MTKFCADIHNNLSLTLTRNGIKVGACCWYKDTTTVQTSSNTWLATNLIDARTINKGGALPSPGCDQCAMMERTGGSSRRTGVNSYYNSTATDLSGPRGLEIKIDYTCNIACVYCSPADSTQWRLELKTPKNIFPIRLKEPDIIEVLDNLDLSNLDNIHFHGGDPLLTNTHEVVLNYIDQRVGLKNVYVWYNTNGTTRVSNRVLDLWSKCNLVKVYFSIDDIGPRFEYIRYGAVWNQCEDNMMWFKETSPVNTMFAIQPTMSCLNALNHHELQSWKINNFATNRLGDVTDLTRHNAFKVFELNSMPDELMQKCLKNNAGDQWYVDFIQSFKYNAAQNAQTKKLIQELDARRGLSFARVFPELAPYFT